jgi:RNA polymerase sigma-70 factor (ECF subfamily)
MATPLPRPVDDSDLARAARAGDPSALGSMYERYGTALFNTCRHLTGSTADAEDLVHDLFVGLPEALQRYEERGHLGAWLKRVAVRMALMHLRSMEHRRHVSLERAATVATRRRSDERIDAHALEDAIAALPTTLRAVFVLNRIEGYSHDEVATLLGITAGASRVRLTRALEALRRSLA